MVTFAVIDGMYGRDGITLPVGGKDYLVRPPGARLGIEIWDRLPGEILHAEGHREMATLLREFSDADERAGGDLEKRVLGPALDEMIADEVPWPTVRLAFQTVLVWVVRDVWSAARFWAAGGGDGDIPVSSHVEGGAD